jgi:hypothetical protein
MTQCIINISMALNEAYSLNLGKLMIAKLKSFLSFLMDKIIEGGERRAQWHIRNSKYFD